MPREEQERISKRNAMLRKIEDKLRDMVNSSQADLDLANLAIVQDHGQARELTQTQVFQLLQDRLQEVVFPARIYRY